MIRLDGVVLPDYMVRHFERSEDSDNVMIGVYGDSDSAVFSGLADLISCGVVKRIVFGDVTYLGYVVFDHIEHLLGENKEVYVKLERRK